MEHAALGDRRPHQYIAPNRARKEKIACLKLPRHMSYQPVLIHAGAAAGSIAEQDYFAKIVDFGELFLTPVER